jgi:hypothetical protein
MNTCDDYDEEETEEETKQRCIAEYRNIRELVYDSVKRCGNALQYSYDWWDDEYIVLASVKNDGLSLQYASDNCRKTVHIVLAAVKQNGYALRYADDNLKANPVIVLAAVRKDYMAWSYACKSIRYRTDIHETAYFMVTK